jgi:hypothetical protein
VIAPRASSRTAKKDGGVEVFENFEDFKKEDRSGAGFFVERPLAKGTWGVYNSTDSCLKAVPAPAEPSSRSGSTHGVAGATNPAADLSSVAGPLKSVGASARRAVLAPIPEPRRFRDDVGRSGATARVSCSRKRLSIELPRPRGRYPGWPGTGPGAAMGLDPSTTPGSPLRPARLPGQCGAVRCGAVRRGSDGGCGVGGRQERAGGRAPASDHDHGGRGKGRR